MGVDMDNLIKKSMNEEIARQIALWKYEGHYEVYNLPSFEEMKENNYGMVNPKKADNYICYLKNDEVVAYTSMKEMSDGRIYFGIGLKPEYCGKKMGNYFTKDSLEDIKKRFPNSKIYLEIRSWNKRALKSAENIGFVTTDTIIKKDRLGNDSEFVEMELND